MFLGPIIFLLFIADINSYLRESTNLQKLADDLLTYEIIFDRNCDNTQQAVDSINKWAEDKKKTKHMFIKSNDQKIGIIKRYSIIKRSVSYC